MQMNLVTAKDVCCLSDNRLRFHFFADSHYFCIGLFHGQGLFLKINLIFSFPNFKKNIFKTMKSAKFVVVEWAKMAQKHQAFSAQCSKSKKIIWNQTINLAFQQASLDLFQGHHQCLDLPFEHVMQHRQ